MSAPTVCACLVCSDESAKMAERTATRDIPKLTAECAGRACELLGFIIIIIIIIIAQKYVVFMKDALKLYNSLAT